MGTDKEGLRPGTPWRPLSRTVTPPPSSWAPSLYYPGENAASISIQDAQGRTLPTSLPTEAL